MTPDICFLLFAKFQHMYLIMYSDFMVIVEPWLLENKNIYQCKNKNDIRLFLWSKSFSDIDDGEYLKKLLLNENKCISFLFLPLFNMVNIFINLSVVICVYCIMSCPEIFLSQDDIFQHSTGCTRKFFSFRKPWWQPLVSTGLISQSQKICQQF